MTRYCYCLDEMRKPAPMEIRCDTIAHLETDAGVDDLDRLRAELRPWALAILQAGTYEMGLFAVTLNEVLHDELGDDDLGDCHGEVLIGWSGSHEVMSSAEPRVPGRG
jgi:hypothetical protein